MLNNNLIFSLQKVRVLLEEFVLDFTQHHLLSFYDHTRRETIHF